MKILATVETDILKILLTKKPNVQLVTSLAILVLKQLQIVMYVMKTEHQVLSQTAHAPMDNTKITMEYAKHVNTIVKLVQILQLIAKLVKKLTIDPPQKKDVHVMMDIMILKPQNVKNVLGTV